MRRPSDKALELASALLSANKSEEDGDWESCQEVGAWLEWLVREREVRRCARVYRVPVAEMRKRLKP